MLANIVDCGNTVEKFRRLRISNGKFHDGVWCKSGGSQACCPHQLHRRTFTCNILSVSAQPCTVVPAGGKVRFHASRACCLEGLSWMPCMEDSCGASAQVMHAAGFRVVGDALVLLADASLPALQCLLMRLRSIASHRGQSGDAEFFPLPTSRAEGAGGSSPYLVSPTLARPCAVLCLCCHQSTP